MESPPIPPIVTSWCVMNTVGTPRVEIISLDGEP